MIKQISVSVLLGFGLTLLTIFVEREQTCTFELCGFQSSTKGFPFVWASEFNIGFFATNVIVWSMLIFVLMVGYKKLQNKK